MRAQYVLLSLLGGVSVFVACAVQRADDQPRTETIADSGTVADAVIDAIRDSLGDSLGVDIEPARDAKAEPTPPTVVTVKCAMSSEGSGGVYMAYATALMAGKSKEYLASGRVMVCHSLKPYCTAASAFEVKDGEARIACGQVLSPADAEKFLVTFTFPNP